MIGSCDYCGEYCQSAEHLEYSEAFLTCQYGHVGPWHGDDGQPMATCSEGHPPEDEEPLDHDHCPICHWGNSAGRNRLLALRSTRSDRRVLSSSPSPEAFEARLTAFIADADRDLRSTRPADRDRVAVAFEAYLGCDVPPIEVVASPRAVDAAVGGAETELLEDATDLPEWTRDTRPGWSMSLPADRWARGIRTRFDGIGADGSTRLRRGLGVASSVASALRRIDVVRDAGQFDRASYELAAAVEVAGASASGERAAYLRLLRELAASCGPVAVLPDRIVVSERPLVLEADEEGRLHAEDGPALAYSDGLVIHAWHGVVVDPWVIREPDRITVEAIDAETNAEVRRVLIERFGAERLLREGDATLVAEDESGRLWRRVLDRWNREEPIVMVEVLNSTPEPDGTRKTYFLRVPPDVRVAREAVAWTFGLSFDTYRTGGRDVVEDRGVDSVPMTDASCRHVDESGPR